MIEIALESPQGSAIDCLRSLSEDLYEVLLTDDLVETLAENRSGSVFVVIQILIDKIGQLHSGRQKI